MTLKRACGCSPPASDREVEAEQDVVWHDPTRYDPVRHGPPYMPVRLAGEARRFVRRAASGLVDPRVARRLLDGAAPLSGVLGVLRAASFLHQTHHWQTSGQSSYADHLLFDRLYKDSQPHIDQVGEKAVGLGHAGLVDPARQAQHVAQLIGVVTGSNAGPIELVRASLRMESLVLAAVQEALRILGASNGLTAGIENLLQGVADLHETFVYLLQQRESDAYDYAR